MTEPSPDFDLIRQIHTVLVLHFVEGVKQSEIAAKLNLSTSKVNRLIAQGRRLGMVQIDIKSPFQRLSDIEQNLVASTALDAARVTPTVSGNADTTLHQVGRAAANLLLETLRDGDVIAITGGKAVSAVVENLSPEQPLDVTVVPLTGGVQGKFYTDVNHLVTRMAERLGGKPILIHAPLFAENRAQRDMLTGMAPIKQVFDLARTANVALTGIGSVEPRGSSYYDLNPVPEADRKMLVGMGIAAEFMAHLIGINGQVADYERNQRLVALHPHDTATCRTVIGVASGVQKARPIQAVLNGKLLNSLVVDEETAAAVLAQMKGSEHAA
ncbi:MULTISPECIES: sugar-binding transcriptional regulator [unclassified Salipiger]|uniref:sugar-binding transcriptional regulator n=1 Tax=unclassified Salipiger TaxID=2640570 RepID=UPI0013B85316|nr:MULTISPECIES: sugar-binding transcriptional regulator [unclassified Salipiger]NDV49847.1 sugar-binding transcriptional regulator [Salipiger sp. PrR003]NDW32484.1 sugar-binding transcriptional regulator [Salipiger sp. PrR007]